VAESQEVAEHEAALASYKLIRLNLVQGEDAVGTDEEIDSVIDSLDCTTAGLVIGNLAAWLAVFMESDPRLSRQAQVLAEQIRDQEIQLAVCGVELT
jgi:hypothetical protein